MKRAPFALAAVIAAVAQAAHADLPRAALGAVRVEPPPHAVLPPGLRFRSAAGEVGIVGERGPPQVLVFADYGCTTLCGPALAIVASRLQETGLAPGRDYRLDVLGLDPASTITSADAFGAQRAPQIAERRMLTADASTIRSATAALGYRYVYDPAARSFAHPVAAFVLTADGRLSRTLSEVTLTAPELKAAIVSARAGEAPNLVQVLAIACHGALAAVGRFDGAALLGLRIAGVATLVAGGVSLALLARRGRKTA